jgi:hypothetical protein
MEGKKGKEKYQHFLLYTELVTRCKEVLDNHFQTRSGYLQTVSKLGCPCNLGGKESSILFHLN